MSAGSTLAQGGINKLDTKLQPVLFHEQRKVHILRDTYLREPIHRARREGVQGLAMPSYKVDVQIIKQGTAYLEASSKEEAKKKVRREDFLEILGEFTMRINPIGPIQLDEDFEKGSTRDD